MLLDVHGCTHAGRREVNEDQYLVAQLNKSLLVEHSSLGPDAPTRLHGANHGNLLAVADGLGGHAAGRDASAIAVDFALRHILDAMPWFARLESPLQETEIDEALRAALDRAHDAVVRLSKDNVERVGMGSTLTLAYTLWPHLFVVHAGDSRCYLFRDSVLGRITTDHTWAERLPEAAAAAQVGHILWNAIGAGTDEVQPEVRHVRLRPDDVLLLCTDGLTGPLADDEIRAVLERSADAETAATTLVQRAYDEGGSDNITAVVGCIRDRAAGAGDRAHRTEHVPKNPQTKGIPA